MRVCMHAYPFMCVRSTTSHTSPPPPPQVVFFDMGHSSCTASAVQFNKSKLKVRGAALNKNTKPQTMNRERQTLNPKP